MRATSQASGPFLSSQPCNKCLVTKGGGENSQVSLWRWVNEGLPQET